MEIEDAEEYTQALGQVQAGGWRQILLGVRLGVTDALGLSTEEWVTDRLGGYVRLSLPERKEAAAELAGEGMSRREIAGVLGVGATTVQRDLAPAVPNGTPQPEDAGADQHVSEPPVPNGTPQPEADGSPAEVDRADLDELIHDAHTEKHAELIDEAKPGVDSADREERRRQEAEADRRLRHTRSFAESVVALWSLLDPDPVAFLGHTWEPNANPHRSTPGAREAFTAAGLRLIAERLEVLAEQADEAGGRL